MSRAEANKIQKPPVEKSLLIQNPQIAKELHPTKNNEITAEQIFFRSGKKFWWKCSKCKGEWEAIVSSRTKINGTGCPFCSGHKASNTNSLAAKFPKIASEWHQVRNGNLTADCVTSGSRKAIWWRCSNGHEWEAIVSSRTRSKATGCPFCSGHKASNTNSLAAKFPQIASQLHPTKNNGLMPEHITAGSGKRLWWKCDKGHEWQAVVIERIHQKRGCPFCASLAAKYPQIAREWHPTKNGSRTPEHVTARSGEKFWWKCDSGHEWQAAVSYRTSAKSGCPLCSGQKVSTSNSLATKSPKIAAQFHPTKNGGFTTNEIFNKSNKKFWWQCLKGHEWQATVASRTTNKFVGSCAFCSGRLPTSENSLNATFPEIASEWHPSQNGVLTPNQVLPGSNKKIWWKCDKGPDHVWRTSVANRTNKVAPTGCPCCSGRKLSVTNSLATKFPKIAPQFHPTKNGNLVADQIIAGSNKKFWWICPKGHESFASVSHRTRPESGCPFCAGQKALPETSLSTKFPRIASELHPTKNGDLTAEQIHFGSNKKLWWICFEGHEWNAVVAKRTKKRNGCPICGNRWPVSRIREFIASLLPHIATFTPAELYSIFQQSGILGIDTKFARKSFVKAVATGKFPILELEKFSRNEPSLADDFLDESRSNLEDQVKNELSVVDESLIDSPDLPVVETTDVLNSLNSPVLSSVDAEVVQFFIASGIAKLWKHAYKETTRAVNQAESFIGEGYAGQVRKKFLTQYRDAIHLKIPRAYTFAIDGKRTEPNLMQRHFASLVVTQKRVGNWSGGGAGKTLSAILATRSVNSSLTVICCPNSTVEGWEKAIKQSFSGSEVAIRTFEPEWRSEDNRYLVLHYEAFQQPYSSGKVKMLLKSDIDFIIIDEVHFAKQRTPKGTSQRRDLIGALVSEAEKKNPNLYVVGMSATPVVNNLYEGKSMVEAITGLTHDELDTRPNVSNCMKLHQKLVTIGIRWLPQYDLEYQERQIAVDCSAFMDQLKALSNHSKHQILHMEQILTEARLPVILENIRTKTVIYTHYIQGIDRILREALIADGWKVGFFTGEDKSGLDQFLYGDLDVLIATSAISTGVDELQHVCNHYVINVLPWTATEFDQLKHRFFRQGQIQKAVTSIIPLTFAKVNGKRWSWCESKMERLKFKRTIADAAVDGVVPEGHLRSPEQAYRDVMTWLQRLDEEGTRTIERGKIVVPLPDTDAQDVRRRLANYGNFADMNRVWNNSHSSKTHDRLQKNPEEWQQYHTLYRQHRKDWAVVPYEDMIRWCKKRKGYVIADFGCGEAKIAEAISDIHEVHSFDHIAINEAVTTCDMAHTPLNGGSLDVAIFSLSLTMGTNMVDYLNEAWRTLRLDGWLHIIEKTSSISVLEEFVKNIERLGFQKICVQDIWKFTHIQMVKTERKPNQS